LAHEFRVNSSLLLWGLAMDVTVIGNIVKTMIYRTYYPDITYDNHLVNINLKFKTIKENYQYG